MGGGETRALAGVGSADRRADLAEDIHEVDAVGLQEVFFAAAQERSQLGHQREGQLGCSGLERVGAGWGGQRDESSALSCRPSRGGERRAGAGRVGV